MPGLTTSGRVSYVTPGVFVDAGGYYITIVNGKIVIKRIPPPGPDNEWPITWTSILISASLQRLATITEKADLEPVLIKGAEAILSAYSKEINGLFHKLNPKIDPHDVPELRYIWLKLFGCDGGGIGILPNGHIVKIPGWTPESLVPLLGSLEEFAEATNKKELTSKVAAVAKAITEAYTPELKKIAEAQHVEELAHV